MDARLGHHAPVPGDIDDLLPLAHLAALLHGLAAAAPALLAAVDDHARHRGVDLGLRDLALDAPQVLLLEVELDDRRQLRGLEVGDARHGLLVGLLQLALGLLEVVLQARPLLGVLVLLEQVERTLGLLEHDARAGEGQLVRLELRALDEALRGQSAAPGEGVLRALALLLTNEDVVPELLQLLLAVAATEAPLDLVVSGGAAGEQLEHLLEAHPLDALEVDADVLLQLEAREVHVLLGLRDVALVLDALDLQRLAGLGGRGPGALDGDLLGHTLILEGRRVQLGQEVPGLHLGSLGDQVQDRRAALHLALDADAVLGDQVAALGDGDLERTAAHRGALDLDLRITGEECATEPGVGQAAARQEREEREQAQGSTGFVSAHSGSSSRSLARPGSSIRMPPDSTRKRPMSRTRSRRARV